MKSTLRRWGWLVFLLPALLCSKALADGKVFVRAVAVPATTPDQRALLHFSNGVERLVIETSFVGSGSNFAWVVPLPSQPQIETVSTNFFSYLSMAYQPEVIQPTGAWVSMVVFGSFLAITIIVIRQKSLAWLGIWFGLVLLFLIFVAGLSVRARSSDGSSVARAGAVEVLDRQSVGIYDTATLRGTDASQLLGWMNTNGFRVPEATLPAISNYAASGWVFVAATLRHETSASTENRPQPLAFTFKTEKAVYPLRLTGIENGACSIELFVFGPSEAQASGFRADYCGEPTAIKISASDGIWQWENFAPPRPGQFAFGNPETKRFAFPAAITTKLSGKLTPEDMRSDAWINWVPARPKHPTFYAPKAAVESGLQWLLAIAIPGLLLILIFGPSRMKNAAIIKASLAVILLGTACGLSHFAVYPTTPVIYVRGGANTVKINLKQINAAFQMFSSDRYNSHLLTESECLAGIGNYLGEDLARDGGKALNPLTLQPLRCEATPGNITLRSTTNGVDVYWHDIYGGPHWMVNFPTNR